MVTVLRESDGLTFDQIRLKRLDHRVVSGTGRLQIGQRKIETQRVHNVVRLAAREHKFIVFLIHVEALRATGLRHPHALHRQVGGDTNTVLRQCADVVETSAGEVRGGQVGAVETVHSVGAEQSLAVDAGSGVAQVGR